MVKLKNFRTGYETVVHSLLCFLLTEQALDIYNAREYLIHNCNNLRKHLLHTVGKAPMQTLTSLDTIL